MTAVVPQPFAPGFRLDDGTDLNNALAYPLVASEDTITAHAAGGKTSARLLTAILNRISVVGSAADSVKLPAALVGRTIIIINDAATNAAQVFGLGTDTINGIATGTGISQPANTCYEYHCTTAGAWIQKGTAGAGAYTGTFDGVVGGTTPAAGSFTTVSASTTNTAGTYFLRSVGNALTAVGTNRATALVLAKEINNITTSTGSTGALLPVGVIGMRVTVFNGGASAITVYANGSETIDGTAGATGVALTNAKRCDYFFTAANTWVSAQLGVVSA